MIYLVPTLFGPNDINAYAILMIYLVPMIYSAPVLFGRYDINTYDKLHDLLV